MALVDDIGTARRSSRLASALRDNQERKLRDYRPSDALLTTRGAPGRPDIVNVNYGGILTNALDKLEQDKAERDLTAAELESENSRRAALDAVLGGESMDARSMVGLADAGVDPGMLKALMPETLGKNQILQYGRDADGMRAVNAIQPGTFTDEQISGAADAARAAKEQDFNDAVRLANATRAPREARSPTELDIALNGTPEQKAALATYLEQKRAKGTGAGGGARGKADPVAAAQKSKDFATRLRGMLESDAADQQLFSGTQAVAIPSFTAIPENAGIVQRMAAQRAQGLESPMAAELRRMGADMSFEVVKQLYPASNTDIKLALSMQPKPGDSRQSMTRFLEKLEEINRKVETGAYGEPVSDGGGVEDESDDALIARHLNPRGAGDGY